MNSLFPQKDKRPLDISVYKGEKRYLIIPYDYSVGGYQVGSKRHVSLPEDISAEEMGNQLLKALETIKESPLDTRYAKQRDYDFSELTGFSTYAKFAKKYDGVDFLLMKDDSYYVGASAKEIKGSGAGWCGEQITQKYLSSFATAREIGESIFEAFDEVEAYYERFTLLKHMKSEFETLSNMRISFYEPNNDHYTDEQDFHAGEIYQGYSYYKEGADESVAVLYFALANELDCDITQEHIQCVYEKYDGSAEKFAYIAIEHPVFNYRIEMESAKMHRIVYLTKVSEDELLSCELLLKKKPAGKRLHDKIMREFEAMVKSCRWEK